jgi:hypothetical protein
MKALKIVLIVLVVLVGGYLIWMASIDPNYDVNREIEIEASPELVWSNIDDLTQWEMWSPWGLADTTMVITYGAITSGLGASYSWVGEEAGTGEMTISVAEPYTYQEVELVFTAPFETQSIGYFRLEPTETGTRLIWGNKGSFPFGMRFMVSSMDEWMGPDFEKGLNNLKELTEKQAAEAGPTVDVTEAEIVDMPAIDYYYTYSENVPWTEIGAQMEEGFGALMAAAGPEAGNMTMAPFAIYTMWDEATQTCSFRNCVSLSSEIQTSELVMKGNYPGGRAVHMAIEAFLEENELLTFSEAWEIYENDPMEVAPEDIITRIAYPLNE